MCSEISHILDKIYYSHYPYYLVFDYFSNYDQNSEGTLLKHHSGSILKQRGKHIGLKTLIFDGKNVIRCSSHT